VARRTVGQVEAHPDRMRRRRDPHRQREDGEQGPTSEEASRRYVLTLRTHSVSPPPGSAGGRVVVLGLWSRGVNRKLASYQNDVVRRMANAWMRWRVPQAPR